MLGSNSIFSASAWSVAPPHTCSYLGFLTKGFPPVYPTAVERIPLFSDGGKCLRKMCSTPQKQPAANVAIWVVDAVCVCQVNVSE